jgi:hypothetical protein
MYQTKTTNLSPTPSPPSYIPSYLTFPHPPTLPPPTEDDIVFSSTEGMGEVVPGPDGTATSPGHCGTKWLEIGINLG